MKACVHSSDSIVLFVSVPAVPLLGHQGKCSHSGLVGTVVRVWCIQLATAKGYTCGARAVLRY